MNKSAAPKRLSAVTNARNENRNNASAIFLTGSKFQGSTLKDVSEKVKIEPANLDVVQNQESIFVCTFCQVFSSSDLTILEHINKVHSNSLPAGVAATRFVSKLQSLPDKKLSECVKKVGRPKKVLKICPPIEEKVLLSKPIPKSDGLYQCDKCERSFKTVRQLLGHICIEAKEDKLEYSSSDSDTTSDYIKYMDVQPHPWSRKLLKNKPNCKNLLSKTNETKNENSVLLQENPQRKVKPNWRSDPEYIPLFPNEEEKNFFENHINSIDYSCIDDLFIVEKHKVMTNMEKFYAKRCNTSYVCTVCSKKGKSLFHIRMHCLTHTDLKPFTCPKCPYQSNTKGSLYTHMRNHTGNIFRCSQCDFQTIKRIHLLNHEETHSTIAQICKLCKNTYKTVRSLIAHVKRYHNHPGGKKYLKSLSSKKPKDAYVKCNICQKRFKSLTNLELHKNTDHIVHEIPQPVELIEGDKDTINNIFNKNMVAEEHQTVSVSRAEGSFPKDVAVVKDPLAEIVLNNLLQQKGSESMELYEDVFDHSINSELMSPTRNLNANRPKSDFNKNLNLDILDECLHNSNFVEDVMNETFINRTKRTNGPFDLRASMELAYPTESLIPPDIAERDENKREPMSAENELFEKCRRAPAYVCCVCSAIYICPATLKVHLKEHVNSSSTFINPTEEFEEPKTSESDAAIDGVCSILQEPSSCEEELEKLFTSSLDMMYYLPEVKVVLENDPSLFDAVWDDISNFSIADDVRIKYGDSEELQVKSSDLFN